ncbi:MAG: hypothetical protein ACXWZZ_10395 [Solirubrobacteraceae bacterium]
MSKRRLGGLFLVALAALTLVLVAPAVAAATQTARQIEAVTRSYFGAPTTVQALVLIEGVLTEVEQGGRDARRMIMATCPDFTDGAPVTELVAAHLKDAVFMSIFQYVDPPWEARTDRFLSSIRRLPGVRGNAALRIPLGLWIADERRLLALMDRYDAALMCADVRAWRAAGWTEAAQPALPVQAIKASSKNESLWRPVRRELLRIGVDREIVMDIEFARDIGDEAILPEGHPLTTKLEIINPEGDDPGF